MIIRIESDDGYYVEKKTSEIDLNNVYRELGTLLIAYGFHPDNVKELFREDE